MTEQWCGFVARRRHRRLLQRGRCSTWWTDRYRSHGKSSDWLRWIACRRRFIRGTRIIDGPRTRSPPREATF